MSVIVKDQELEKFNTYLKEKNWNEASGYLESLNLPKNLELFNKAYLSYVKGDLPQAKLFLEKAKYSGLFSDELASAKALVQTKLEISEFENSLELSDKLHLESLSVPPLFFIVVGLIFSVLAVSSFIKKSWFILICTAALGVGTFAYNHSLKKYDLFISSENQNVFLGPSKIFEQVQVLPKGIKYSISKKSKQWYHIESPREFRGWIYKNKGLNYEWP